MNINEMSDCADIQAENDALIKALDREEQKVADLEAQLAEERRHNELLRAVAEAAKVFGNQTVLFPGYYTISFQHGHNLLLATKAAIDGGALDATQSPD